MTTRITAKYAQNALRAYCAMAGVPYGHYVGYTDSTEPTIQVDQNGRKFTAHLLHTNPTNGRSTYVLTGGLALSGAYGGWQVQRIIGMEWPQDGRPCTGVSTPFGGGFRTPREIVTLLDGARYALAERDVTP